VRAFVLLPCFMICGKVFYFVCRLLYEKVISLLLTPFTFCLSGLLFQVRVDYVHVTGRVDTSVLGG